MASLEIHEPRSLEEAFSYLADTDAIVRPMGGGTALMLMMKAQLFTPDQLVALRGVGANFKGFELAADGSHFRIGALTTFAELEHSPEIQRLLPVIPQTMKTLANARVRNVASVGGNLAHGDPHLDLPPVWTALDAEISIVGPNGKRDIPVGELFAGYYETTLEPDELISEIRVPVKPGWRATYVKVTTRAAHDWPALGISLSAKIDGRKIEDLRLVLSACIDCQRRLRQAEDVLRGAEIDDAVLERAGAAAVAEVEIESDSRGSAGYKKQLLRVHLTRAVNALIGG